MNDPWSVLNLSRAASDEAVRRRYLELVREFSPERAPERFAEIRKAYEELRDPIERVRRQIFIEDAHEHLDGLMDEFREHASSARIPTAALLSLASDA